MKTIPAMGKSWCAGVFLLLALAGTAEAGNDFFYTIKMRDGGDLKCEAVKPEDNGAMAFTQQGRTLLMSNNFYDYVATSRMPDAIAAAVRQMGAENPDYAALAVRFAELAKTYAYCGWDAFCQLKRAEALAADGEEDEAMTQLSGWEDKELSGPEYRQTAIEQGRLMLARLYVADGKRVKAVKVIDQLLASDNEGMATSAFNLLGDMLWKAGHEQDAVLCYLRPVILFDRSVTEREYALRRLSESLEKMGDARSKIYREMLQREYPAKK